jgi:membrane peptidoglycan carboxypeptidase
VSAANYAPRPKQVLWGLLIAALVFGGLAGLAYARTTIPSPSAIASAQTTTIYYSDGTVLARLGSTNRIDVPLSQVPKTVQRAVLAAEDRHFYAEPGISPTGMVRALWVDLRGGDISQGGSTVTQQYVKNAYLSPHRTLQRKLKEILIAAKLGQTRSKTTILDDYLNTIYFGRNAYGIQAASLAYFGRGVANLTTAQGALLAAVIRGPSLYDPRADGNKTKPAAIARWHYVLNGMVSQGWLSQANANSLKFPHTIKRNAAPSQCKTGPLCFIRDDVEHELVASDGLSQSQLDLGGYKIVTTINKNAETSLINAEASVLPKNDTGTPESGAASIKPNNGAIEALYGGAHYCHKPKKNKDACVDLSGFTGQWARPPGSSFKAFTLLAALKKDISLSSTFNGPPTVDVNGTQIHNSSPGESCYGCTLLKAFAESINTIFVPLAQQVGPKNVVKAAYDAGIPQSRNLSAVPDISLGPDQVSPVDLANAYATIAAQGIESTPYLVQSVTTTSGQQIYKATPHLTRAFPQSVTSDETYAMTKVLAPGGTAYGHALSGRPSAGKTGTTDNNTNAWFTGFTPQLCTSVWIGNVDSTKTVSSGGIGEVFGGTLPAEIWQAAMDATLAGQPVEPFPTPADIGTIQHTAPPTTHPTSTPTKTVTPTPTGSPSAAPTITPTVPPTGTPTLSPPATGTATPTKKSTQGQPAESPHRRQRQP